MLNHIDIMGRLTRDPELRYTQSNIPVANFTIAVDRDLSSKDGYKEVDFVDCVAWRGTAEFISKYFRKGSMAAVSGRLQSRKWQDRDGSNRIGWEVRADNVYFGEKRQSGGNESGNYSPPPNQGGFAELDDEDGELPF